MQTRPFDDLDIDENVRKSAYDVWDRMSSLIDARITETKAQMSKQAATAADQASQAAQSQLTQVLNVVDGHLSDFKNALAQIATNPIFAGSTDLVNQSQTLQKAVDAGQTAIAAQRAQIQQYGRTAGDLMQKALMAAL